MRMQDKIALVTGADGFIGSYLADRLVREGSRVRALVYYNARNQWGWLDDLTPDVREGIEVVSGDIRDPHAMRQVATGCNVVFHLAALIGIPYSYQAPAQYVDTNVLGTLNVLQACRELNVERVLITSTSEVYGTAQTVPINESHPRQAQSPYSASKIAADALAESFHRCFGLPITIVRPFNTYGPRQSARAVIPTVITQLLAGCRQIHLGSLHPTRDLVFCKDTAEGFVRLALSDRAVGQEVNIATQSEISVGDLARKIIARINPHAEIVCDAARVRPEKSEVDRLFGSNTRLMELTGWQPKTTIDEGLAQTIKWFSEADNRRFYKHDLYNV